MAKFTSILFLLVLLAAYVSAGFERRDKRGFNISGFGNNGRRYSGDSDERDASVSREDNERDCSGDNQNSGSGSREMAYNRDNRQLEKHRGGRSFAKSTSSAPASSFNEANNASV